MLIGGYIKNFKGFGIEIETRLQTPINQTDIIIRDVINRTFIIEKGTVDRLSHMSRRERENIKTLKFYTNGTYSFDDIILYFQKLPFLKYLVICDIDNTFICLIPKRIFTNTKEDFNERLIANYLTHPNRHIPRDIPDAITSRVNENEKIINILIKMRKDNLNVIVVVSNIDIFEGIVEAKDLEKLIVDITLTANGLIAL